MCDHIRPIYGDDRYHVDIWGNVYGPRGRLALFFNKSYPQVKVIVNGKRRTICVHRIVLETFIGPCPEGMECCHRNGNAADNRLGNLRWGTRQSNAADKIRHGTTLIGERNSHARLTRDDVLAIRDLHKLGFNNLEIARFYRVTHSNHFIHLPA